MSTNYGFNEDEIADILARESLRIQRHDQWCNDHEGEFTDADGVQTMTTGFWGKGEY